MRGGMRHKAVVALGCALLVAVTAACSEDVNPNDQGMLFFEQGDYQKAIEAFDEAIRLNPQDAEAYYHRGVAQNSLPQPQMRVSSGGQSRYQSAIKDFDAAIRLNPQSDAYYNRGVAYRKLGQFERAIEDYEEAIRLDPQYAEAYYLSGAAYGAIGKSVEAERDFAKAKGLGYPPLGLFCPQRHTRMLLLGG